MFSKTNPRPFHNQFAAMIFFINGDKQRHNLDFCGILVLLPLTSIPHKQNLSGIPVFVTTGLWAAKYIFLRPFLTSKAEKVAFWNNGAKQWGPV